MSETVEPALPDGSLDIVAFEADGTIVETNDPELTVVTSSGGRVERLSPTRWKIYNPDAPPTPTETPE